MQLFFTFPLNTQHFSVCLSVCVKWKSKAMICGLNMNWALFNSTNKSYPESNITHAIGHCCHVSYGKFQHSWCFAFVLTAAFVIKSCLKFHTWCLFTRKGIFLLMSFLLCWFFFSLVSPPGPLLCAASGLYKTWCYCVCLLCFILACVHTFTYIRVYFCDAHNLFFSLKHPCEIVWMFFPLFFEKMAKSREENVIIGDVLFFLCPLTQKEIFFLLNYA